MKRRRFLKGTLAAVAGLSAGKVVAEFGSKPIPNKVFGTRIRITKNDGSTHEFLDTYYNSQFWVEYLHDPDVISIEYI